MAFLVIVLVLLVLLVVEILQILLTHIMIVHVSLELAHHEMPTHSYYLSDALRDGASSLGCSAYICVASSDPNLCVVLTGP